MIESNRLSIRGGEPLLAIHHSRVVAEVRSLRRALKILDRSLNRLAPMLLVSIPNGNSKPQGRSRPRLSPKARASMVLQGRYMGYMRQLKPRQKAQVRTIRKNDGIRAAIQRARKVARA